MAMNTPTLCKPRPLWALSAEASTMPCWPIAPSKPKRRRSTPGILDTMPYAAGKLSRGCVLLREGKAKDTGRTTIDWAVKWLSPCVKIDYGDVASTDRDQRAHGDPLPRADEEAARESSQRRSRPRQESLRVFPETSCRTIPRLRRTLPCASARSRQRSRRHENGCRLHCCRPPPRLRRGHLGHHRRNPPRVR